MPFPILDLPPELVGIICSELDDTTLMNVRRTSRTLKVHSSTAFGTRFFNHVVAILHPVSLTILLEIARHHELSKFVNTVTIGGERIGGVINMSIKEDEERLKDLQTSMERSGMDRLILDEVFRELQNLEIVRMDNSSFLPEFAQVDAVRCGKFHLFGESSASYNVASNERNLNREYSLVLDALVKAGKHEKVKLYFVFCAEASPTPNDSFDLDSEHWRKSFRSNVQYVRFYGGHNSEWGKSLLTAPNLKQLEVYGRSEIFDFSHPSAGLFHWPNLQKLALNDTRVIPKSFLAFLEKHSPTMTHLHLQAITLLQGTWTEPLQIVEGMPKLHYVFLNVLWERKTPSMSEGSFSRFYDDGDLHGHLFHMYGHTTISLVVRVLLSDLRTTRVRPKGVSGFGTYYEVDFRKARAALAGKIVYCDGEWKSKDDEDESVT
ncbi:hypothetical protein BU26DRAFT_579611 [Trematosphaeria pertusa]|uniref:F-box domain-containing protein n=1 Tax=Trematosphaeria pertusa TaxID=390896 RepID=A0A6A6I3K2_9PLEO|nr:uncharacterized protein BU26DRAFT_579611 [Trematosphaeria pertusa]KAF2244866.1 hypothetical protein BU26DRAFT_579611 [Trematosphaeria pertusa]